MNKPGFMLVTAEDASAIVSVLSSLEDATMRAIAARLRDGGAKAESAPASRPRGRRASELWDTYQEVRKRLPVSLAAFLAQEKDPFPGTDGAPRSSGRCSKEQMEDRIEVCMFCILAQPNGTTHDVYSLLAAKWGVSEQMVSRTMKHASERLRGQARPDDDLRAKVVAHGWNVYDAALRSKRPQAAATALDGIARNSGLVRNGVEVNIYERPEFIEATGKVVEQLHGALDVATVAAALPHVDKATIAAVLEAARNVVDQRMAALAGPPMLEAAAE